MLRDLDILEIDYSASNTDYRRTEYHKTADLSGNYLIPFEGPMFVRNLVVRAEGSPLTIETDYTIEDDFEELELMTGKKVIGCIKLSNKVMNDYKEIKIVYQKVGEVIVSRNFLLESVDKILNNDRPVDWLTQVLGKPSTYTPAYHIHDVREKNELVGFSDLLLLFKQASGDIKRSGLVVWNQLKVIEDKAFQDLDDTYKYLWNLIFKHIMNVTNPHNITKSNLGLGNHPNYGTASLEEDQAAAYYTYPDKNLRGDVISTPHGVKSAINNFTVDSDGYVKQGSIPFSYYGSGFYLPPPIKGSFEGLGTNLGVGCGCLESNGVFTVLARGYDSKVRSLYYYYSKTPYDINENYIFSGVKYDHPFIKADNELLLQQYKDANNGSDSGYIPLEANHIISGSSGLVVMLGDITKNQYYIGLGNGTLDYNSHVLKRIDIEDFRDSKEGMVFDAYRSCVMLIGDYVYIIAQTNKWPVDTPDSAKFNTSATYRMRMFFRANKADLSSGASDTIKFKKQSITYTDTDGNTHTEADTVEMFPYTIGKTSDGKPYCKRLMVDWEVIDPNFTQIYLTPYHCQWLYKQNPSDKNKASVRMLHGIQYWYYGERTIGTNMMTAVPMDFDAEKGILTLDRRWFRIKYNVITDDKTVPEAPADLGIKFTLDQWYHAAISSFVANFDEVGAAWIDGIGVYSLASRVHALPYTTLFMGMGNYNAKGNVDQWTAFNKDYAQPEYILKSIPMDSPFGFTSMPGNMADLWYCDGVLRNAPIELFKSLDKNGNLANYYRAAEDADYQKRDELKFPYVGKDIYSRSPNANFGTYQLADRTKDLNDRYLPIVNIAVKDVRSVQYGIFRLFDNENDGTHPKSYSPLYSYDTVKTGRVDMDKDGGFYLDTLGTHTLDSENAILSIKPDTSGRLWITKSFWRGLIKILLGSKDAIAGTNGINGTGEYNLSVFMAQPLSNKTIPISMAFITWHEVSTNADIAKLTYSSFITFDWVSAGKNSAGFTIPKINSYNFPSNNWGGNGDGGTVTYESFQRDTAGRWGYRQVEYNYSSLAPTIQAYGTDKNNYECYFSTGVQQQVVGGAGTPKLVYRIKDGTITEANVAYEGIYTMGSSNRMKQAVYGVGLLDVIAGDVSGGSALYVQMPDNKSYGLLESVFVKGNWTLFIGTDLDVIFNGHTRTLKSRNYSLDQLGISPENKTFYLYAVCGKTEGYYDLTLSERTASPYHMLVATIITISTGIKTIDVTQIFAVSGFTISTQNKGGIVPATTGTFASDGKLSAVTTDDLFDSSKY